MPQHATNGSFIPLGPDGPPIVPQTPANSLVPGDFGQEIHITNEVSHDMQEDVLTKTNAVLGNIANSISFLERPPWQPLLHSNLQWTWKEDSGPFITNGQSYHSQFTDSDNDSDTTTIMFNLDSLNDTGPEAMQNQGWEKGCIPESPDSFIESLVQRVDSGRFKFELGDSSTGPSLRNSQSCNPVNSLGQSVHNKGRQTMDLGPNERELSPFEMLTLGPGPSLHLTTQLPSNQDSGLWCNETSEEVVGVEGPKPTSKKTQERNRKDW